MSFYDNWRICVIEPCKRLYQSKCFLPYNWPLPRHCVLTKDMQLALNILWYMARQSSILSMPSEGFVSASSSSFFSLILLMLCPKSEIWAAASSRKGITSWKFYQILISVQLRCVWRESFHLEYPKSASDQPHSSSWFESNCRWQDRKFKIN